jgi:hypothetical protein
MSDIRYMGSLDEMHARIGTVNCKVRGSRFEVQSSRFKVRADSAVGAPDGRFMDSLYETGFAHWDLEPLNLNPNPNPNRNPS